MRLRLLLYGTLPLCGICSVVAGDRLCPAIPEPSARRLIAETCSDVRQKLATVPGVSVRSSETSFVDSRFGCTRAGCVVALSGSFSALRERASPDSWLGEYLQGKGWSRTLSHDADGPDGTSYALHRPGALCIVAAEWSHWHDEDGESRTDDAYGLTVSCGGAEQAAPGPPQ